MKEKLQKIREDAIRQIEASGDLSKLNDVRVAVLGKKGELTAVLKRRFRQRKIMSDTVIRTRSL